MRRRLMFLLSVGAVVWAIETAGALAAESPLRGAWRPESYILKDGSRHPMEGLVVFTDTEWTFVVFVMADGEPRRGEGEGGTYTLKGDDLVFSHEFLLTAGGALGSLPESPLRMQVRDTASAAKTPARASLEADRLTIRFGPSGNTMVFRRLSRF
ncbi:MAG: hypothetical protein ACRD2N_07510 [Vicinamibacterales bacterium]